MLIEQSQTGDQCHFRTPSARAARLESAMTFSCSNARVWVLECSSDQRMTLTALSKVWVDLGIFILFFL
jgi:hypothetical protein